MLAVLQLDAINVSLFERLMAEGRLPTMAGLRRQGRWFGLEAPGWHMDAGASFTVYSGLNVGQHGLYYPFQWSPSEQRVRYTTSFPLPETVWEQLSRMGRCSLVIDPYFGWPPAVMNGICLSGWQLTNRVVLRRWATPRGELRRLSRRYGSSPAADEVFGRPSLTWLRSLRERLLPTAARAADAALDCLGRKRFDLLWLTFVAPHIAGHWLWDFPQLVERNLPSAVQEELETALVDVYVAVDTALGRILTALRSDTDVMVLSPIGMGANTSRSDLLPAMLAAVLAEAPAGGRHAEVHGRTLASRLRDAVPTDLRDGIARVLPSRLTLALIARLEQPRVSWNMTAAFAVPSDNQGYVRLNIRGRERDGIVDPVDVAGLIEKISTGLLTFRDLDGCPSVAKIDRTSEIFPGPRSSLLPDLVVKWSDRPTMRLRGVTSSRYGDVARLGVGTGRSGTHTGEAWALVVPGSSRVREPSRPPHLVDIAATVCSILGADPKKLAGEPLLEP